jgi:hypothetical protein
MNYLSPTEYESYGLEATTPASWVSAASALIDGHCRRATLGLSQYTERIRMVSGRNTFRLTYLPVSPVAPATSAIISARGRYAVPRRGEWPYEEMSSVIAWAFGLPGLWNDLAPADLDLFGDTGEVSLPVNALGLAFSEIEIVYTAGLATISDPVKTACAQIVRNAQATPALNVKRGRLDRMYLDYFSDSLLDSTVQELLAPYVAQKVG